ncbi:MAG: hypothetical protein IKW20_07255 [Bacteroidales bacterium]|nr:hypothetical protein [Bacteroidales bacterium]MBR5834356.1 hypothetical protein [Bacteroidales bacterium]
MKKVLMSMAVLAAMIAFAACGNNTKKAEDKAAEATEQCCAEGCCKGEDECTKAEGCCKGEGECAKEGCCKEGACTEQECAECTECTECPDCPAGESAE